MSEFADRIDSKTPFNLRKRVATSYWGWTIRPWPASRPLGVRWGNSPPDDHQWRRRENIRLARQGGTQNATDCAGPFMGGPPGREPSFWKDQPAWLTAWKAKPSVLRDDCFLSASTAVFFQTSLCRTSRSTRRFPKLDTSVEAWCNGASSFGMGTANTLPGCGSAWGGVGGRVSVYSDPRRRPRTRNLAKAPGCFTRC